MADSHNNINVLQRSAVFGRLAEGNARVVHYEINSHPYTKCYYVIDGIYPKWSTFMKTIREPTEEKIRGLPDNKRLAGRIWSMQMTWEVMTAWVIMHNMIVDDEPYKGIMTNGGNFRVSWLLYIYAQLHLRSSSMCTKRFMIAPLTISYRRI
jgi:hypothetical protein